MRLEYNDISVGKAGLRHVEEEGGEGVWDEKAVIKSHGDGTSSDTRQA